MPAVFFIIRPGRNVGQGSGRVVAVLFLSNFTNKIDKKGRVSVPASFRTILGNPDSANQNFSTASLPIQSFVNPCIEACGMGLMEKLYRSIDSMEHFSEQRDAFATSILGRKHSAGV